ncbi:MAG: hypothetical protein HW386_2311 [Gammaproteobacteria bacterium]|nr:hypothetical protein [Gammaproteobacteria bacterium]
MLEKLTGGEAMIRAAMANGINTVFGLPGAQIYPLFDALQRLGVKTIVTRHEQGAAYMAMGYMRKPRGNRGPSLSYRAPVS